MKPTNRQQTVNRPLAIIAGLLGAFCICTAASAFPTWIGVYGSDVRHTDSSNPGTYTILLNQSYTGLHAEVGVQVNNGAWTAYQMSYAGLKDGNSKWTFTPAAAYPDGATVKYYFHGFDDWGGNIWDSNNGANYSFAVSGGGGSGPIPWPGGGAAGYPSDPASRIHHWKEEAVVGNGYMTVMLDQNGSLYDIYYPSAGNRHGASTANEGYRGPEDFPSCWWLDNQANGQMNVIAGMGGIGIGGNIYWMKNSSGTDYTGHTQRYVADNNVVYTSYTLNATGNRIKIDQYDFVPATTALPTVSNGTRSNYGAYVKRFLLTNLESTSRTFDFYYDVNFNVNGGNGNDVMYFDNTRKTMMVYDRTERSVPVQANSCDPNGYTTEYSPSFAFDWYKGSSIYFGTALKLVTNPTTGAGTAADGSWRDYTGTDNQEGWIAKRVTINPGQTVEIDVAIVGAWDDQANQTGTFDFWGVPLVDWFYNNSMATAQSTTETYWSNWLNSGVTADFPDDRYDALFKRSLLVSALHVDKASGSIIAGMHNGAYPFVWPRDAVYAAVTFARTGHLDESLGAYRWLRDVAYRETDNAVGGKAYFYQKYTTDGWAVWTSPQLDESASVPWGIWFHYQMTGDQNFLNSYWNLAYTTARASSENSGINPDVKSVYGLMNGNNVWEDSWGPFIYSNGSIVRGLRDAANIADVLGQGGWASTFRSRADGIKTAIDSRIDARVEPADISHLGLVVPYEVYAPTDGRMRAIDDWIHGRTQAGGFNDNLVEQGGDIAGLLRRFNHRIDGGIDNYWNGGPWPLATAWYGMYFARWQDYEAGKDKININKDKLDRLIAKLGPAGLSCEQIAPGTAQQKYPGFWHQTAWPNVWESHSTLVDAMMMFLDFKPNVSDNTAYLAPKLPSGWSTITFNGLRFRDQRFNVTVTEAAGNVRADLNKLTGGAMNLDIYLRVPTGSAISSVQFNGGNYTLGAGDYDATTGRVHVRGALNNGANSIVVNYGGGCSGPNLQWAGNQYAWPPAGQVTSQSDVWGNIESWPRGAANYARVVYTTNGGASWNTRDLEWGGVNGNNDWWHINLGKFSSRTTIRYAIEVRDCYGRSIWDNNNGADYRVTVN